MPDFFTSLPMMFTPSCAFGKGNIKGDLSEQTRGVELLTRWEGLERAEQVGEG